ncbi:MFS transporter [Streptomyces sp. NPDC093224]|uniref:MFS transporter n=1 Tax=Streptomyces sp. NPDC093224 TaxID=3155198 RepID=UPI0034158F0D
MKRARRPLAYGAGNLGVQLLAQVFATYAAFYYIDRLGVDAALIGVAMVVHGVAGAVLNPLLGHVSDRTRTRWGRRTPYIGLGMVPLAAVSTLIWIPLFDGATARFWYFLITVLVYDVLFVCVVLNHVSLFPEMFRTTRQRAAAAPARQMFGIIGMVLGVAGAPVVHQYLGWPGTGLCFSLIALAALAVSLTGSTEEAAPDPGERAGLGQALRHTLAHRAFLTYVTGSFLLQLVVALMQGAVPFFSKYVLHRDDVANSHILGTVLLTAVPAVFLWGRVLARWGGRTSILATTLVLAGALAPFLFVSSLAGALIASALTGVAVAGMMVLLEVLLAEVIDDDAARHGGRREGLYVGMNGFVVRWSVSVQAAITSVVLTATGYRAGAASQSEEAVRGLRLMLGGIPLVLLALAFVAFLLHPLRRRPAVRGARTAGEWGDGDHRGALLR